MLGWVSQKQKGRTTLGTSKEEQKNDKMGTSIETYGLLSQLGTS